MKSKTKFKIIILITLGIIFALALIINFTPGLFTDNNNVIDSDDETPKISAVSGKICIINNSGWVDFRNAGNCTGSGTYSDPYVIEDLEIDGRGLGNPIWVENSSVYFKIENCSVYNSTWGGPDLISDAGIRLLNVSNSHLIGNDCSSSYLGIDLSSGCYNNTITGNIVNNNGGGIHLSDSYNNTVSGNTVNNNTWSGIYILGSNYTIISENTMNDNNFHGIHLLGGHNNVIISGNTINDNNMHGIWIKGSYNNTISGNTMNKNNWSGICLIDSIYNIISGNIANHNTECGILLFQSNYNTISGNTANYNQWGIFLYNNGNNIVSGNTLIGNDECIVELDCQGNVIQDNDCTLTPSLNYLPSILIISTAIIGVSVFIIYQNRKRFKRPQKDLDFL